MIHDLSRPSSTKESPWLCSDREHGNILPSSPMENFKGDWRETQKGTSEWLQLPLTARSCRMWWGCHWVWLRQSAWWRTDQFPAPLPLIEASSDSNPVKPSYDCRRRQLGKRSWISWHALMKKREVCCDLVLWAQSTAKDYIRDKNKLQFIT